MSDRDDEPVVWLDDRLNRIEKAILTMASRLVEAQPGFTVRDLERIVAILKWEDTPMSDQWQRTVRWQDRDALIRYWEERVAERDARIKELEEALIRWHTDEGDCECREIHMLNLCRSCSADLNLRELAAAIYAARKAAPDV